MPKLTDLTGREVDGWTVLSPAETIKRIRFWNVIHSCGELAVRPHAMLTTNAVAPCPTCEPATEAGITLGHHQGPGDPAHLVGTPCGPVGHGECKHGGPWRECSTCAPLGGVTIPEVGERGREVVTLATGGVVKPGTLELHGGIRRATDYPTAAFQAAVAKAQEEVARLAGRFSPWTIPDLAACPEPELEDAHELVDASEGIVSWAGRAEAAAEAQMYLAVIRTKITQPAKAPYVGTGRSPGMSSLGGCERKLGGLLAFGKPLSVAWRPAIGTAADEHQLGPAFEEDNRRTLNDWYQAGQDGPAPTRWITKAKLRVGEPAAYGILDLYDRWAEEVVDFKVSGVTKLEATRKGRVTDQYEVQLDLYGLGMTQLGYPVRTVALLVLPMGGKSCELEDASYYRRTWNPDNAYRALARRDRIMAMLAVAEPEAVLASLGIQEDACDYCPVLKMGLCEGVNVRQDKGLAQIGWNPTPISLPAPPPGV